MSISFFNYESIEDIEKKSNAFSPAGGRMIPEWVGAVNSEQ